MNKDRRKRLTEALALLDKAETLLNEADQIVTEVRDEEQEAFDNLSEGLQQSERGQLMEEAISSLESFDVESFLNDARESIENAIAA